MKIEILNSSLTTMDLHMQSTVSDSLARLGDFFHLVEKKKEVALVLIDSSLMSGKLFFICTTKTWQSFLEIQSEMKLYFLNSSAWAYLQTLYHGTFYVYSAGELLIYLTGCSSSGIALCAPELLCQ